MNRAKRMPCVSLLVMVFVGSVLFSAGALGRPQDKSTDPTGFIVRLGIDIDQPDGSVFYIPAVGNGEMTGVIPVLNLRFAGIRITPTEDADSVKIQVSALVATQMQLSEVPCNDVRLWKSEEAGSYAGKAFAFLRKGGSSQVRTSSGMI